MLSSISIETSRGYGAHGLLLLGADTLPRDVVLTGLVPVNAPAPDVTIGIYGDVLLRALHGDADESRHHLSSLFAHRALAACRPVGILRGHRLRGSSGSVGRVRWTVTRPRWKLQPPPTVNGPSPARTVHPTGL